MQEVHSQQAHSISPRLQSPAPRRTRRIADYHPRDTRGRPVGTFRSSSILQPGQLHWVQSIFSTRTSHHRSQPLSTDPWNVGGYTPTTLIPLRSSLPGAPSAPVRALDQAACQMPLFPEGFNKAKPRGPSEDVWCPVLRPPAGQIMSGHSSDSIGAQVGTHVPGRGIYGMHCTGNSGGGVTFSTGDRNRAK